MLRAGTEKLTALHQRKEAGLKMMLLGHIQQKSVSLNVAVVKTANSGFNIRWRPVWAEATGVSRVVQKEIHSVDRDAHVHTHTIAEASAKEGQEV